MKTHNLSYNADKRGYQAICSCNKYRSRWQPFKDMAERRGRLHVQYQLNKERKREADRGTR